MLLETCWTNIWRLISKMVGVTHIYLGMPAQMPVYPAAFRPVRMGDVFTVRNSTQDVEFRIVNSDPPDLCIVGEDTIVVVGAYMCAF